MTALWTTGELPGTRWDPDPDDGDDGPWCRLSLNLDGQGTNVERLLTMTTVQLKGDIL